MQQGIVEEFGRIPMAQALAGTLVRAAEAARMRASETVTLEHLLLALTEDPDAGLIFQVSSIDLSRLAADIDGHLAAAGGSPVPGGPVQAAISPDLRRVLEAAAAAAQQGRRREINGAIVLAAIVGDGRSVAAQILRAHGLTFEEAIKALQRAARPAAPSPQPMPPMDQEAVPRSQAPPAGVAEASRDVPTMPPRPPDEPRTGEPRQSTEELLASVRERISAQAPHRAAPPSPPPGPGPAPPTPATGPAEGAAFDPHHFDAMYDVPSTLPPTRPPPKVLEPQPPPRAEPGAPYAPQWENAQLPATPPAMPAPGYPQAAAPPPPRAPAPAPQPPPQQGPEAAPRAEPPRQPPAAPPQHQAPPQPPGLRPAPPPMPETRRAQPGPAAPWPEPPQEQSRRPPAAPPPMGPASHLPAPNDGPRPGDRPMGGRVVTAPPQRSGPPPQPAPHAGERGTSAPGIAVDTGQLIENIPRAMRVSIPTVVEVRIGRKHVQSIGKGMAGGGPAVSHAVLVTRAMSVRLRAPDGGFFIETASPETQWIDNTLGVHADDYASWRWTVTPKLRGVRKLQLVVAARTVGADGLAAETALPEQVVEVRVRVNYAATMKRAAGWVIAAVLGGALARFGEGGLDIVRALIKPLSGG